MSKTPEIKWNDNILLAISDVDDTLAETYTPAEKEVINEISSFLHVGRKLFMVTGGSLARIKRDITQYIDPTLRQNILVSHCSGAEVWGFDGLGNVREKPFYSIYEDTFTAEMKVRWREVIDQLVREFDLHTHPAQPKSTFWEKIGRDPKDIMLDDRGPQITMEVVNGTDMTSSQLVKIGYSVPFTHGMYDLRIAILNRAELLLSEANIPISPNIGGTFALDFAVEGVSKTTSIESVLSNTEILKTLGLQDEDIINPNRIEVWGDKYSVIHGGTDRYMSEALSPKVRSIDFRQENPDEFPKGYNIVLWDGEDHLHKGLLEYLRSSHAQ